MLNKGDLAMLQVTVARLRRRLPEARIGVPTTAPARLAAFCPGVEPVVVAAGADWGWEPGRLGGALGHVPPAPRRLLMELPDAAEPRLRAALRPVKRALTGGPAAAAGGAGAEWVHPVVPIVAAGSAGLVIALGGGHITDGANGMQVLDTLRRAADAGVPTVMLGQGIGPVVGDDLRRAAAEVLPRLGLIALREKRAGLPLVEELGVPMDRVVVTGDDAIAAAHAARRPRLGGDIGVNMRVASYAAVGVRDLAAVGASVRHAAEAHGSALVPLLVSEWPDEDRPATRALTRGFRPTVHAVRRLTPPAAVMRRVSRCRVVVTGTYHAAVFALAQGIPVVCLPRTAYYVNKFLGLDDMFGGGCTVVSLDEPDLEARLDAAIAAAWEGAPAGRAALLAAAADQIARSRDAFERGVAAAVQAAPAAAGR